MLSIFPKIINQTCTEYVNKAIKFDTMAVRKMNHKFCDVYYFVSIFLFIFKKRFLSPWPRKSSAIENQNSKKCYLNFINSTFSCFDYIGGGGRQGLEFNGDVFDRHKLQIKNVLTSLYASRRRFIFVVDPSRKRTVLFCQSSRLNSKTADC